MSKRKMILIEVEVVREEVGVREVVGEREEVEETEEVEEAEEVEEETEVLEVGVEEEIHILIIKLIEKMFQKLKKKTQILLNNKMMVNLSVKLKTQKRN